MVSDTVSSSVAAAAGVEQVSASAYTIPTDRPESDGTLEWDSTTIVVVEAFSAGSTGLGWTYAPAAAVHLIEDVLAPVVRSTGKLDPRAAYAAMQSSLRNPGYPGLGAMAVSAVDVALWDLEARLLELPLSALLGRVRESVPIYGSGGFCSYSDGELTRQLGGWVDEGIPRVKMKIGREPARDPERVAAARRAIGDEAELYVDANGAFRAKQALRLLAEVEESRVTWFEEPVSSRDLAGLRVVRDAAAEVDVAAGEYAYTLADFRGLVDVVDCLQADVTRCGGVTGLLAAAALAEAFELDLSGHTAPTIHGQVLCAVPRLRHLEWFHDHVRIERLLFDGFVEPEEGEVRPDPDRPGLGVELKRADAAEFSVR
jgi:L-alanine-DL-glutamate epimerase-like enolase superfamily enzyme